MSFPLTSEDVRRLCFRIDRQSVVEKEDISKEQRAGVHGFVSDVISHHSTRRRANILHRAPPSTASCLPLSELFSCFTFGVFAALIATYFVIIVASSFVTLSFVYSSRAVHLITSGHSITMHVARGCVGSTTMRHHR